MSLPSSSVSLAVRLRLVSALSPFTRASLLIPYQLDEQRQKYTLPLVHTIKEMASLVHIELDPATGKITKLEDRWDNKSLSNVSGITKKLRDFNGSYFTPALVSVPK